MFLYHFFYFLYYKHPGVEIVLFAVFIALHFFLVAAAYFLTLYVMNKMFPTPID